MFTKDRLIPTVVSPHERPPRRAAKAVLTLPNGLIIFVAGKRGMFNFAGGGLELKDKNDPASLETPMEAFYRETPEETGLQPSDLYNVREVGEIEGRVTDSRGGGFGVHWTLVAADVAVPFERLFIPEGSEITAQTALSRRQCLEHRNMSNIAKRVVLRDFLSVR